MSKPRTSRHPSFNAIGAAILLALLCSLLLSAGAQATGGKAGSHAQVAKRKGKKATHRGRIARASKRKHPRPVEEPTTTEPIPTESTTTPTETTTTPTETTTTPTETTTSPTEGTTSEPAPTPTEPVSSSDLLFSGNRIGDFWLNQSAPNAITEVTDPAGSSQKVFKMTVADSDVYPITPSENPRAQLLSPPAIEPGDEIWWHSKFFLPSSFPSSVPGWLNLLEGPYGSPFNGSPPWQIQVVGNYIQWTRNKTYSWDVPWRMPLVKEKWVDVLVHERFGSQGWVEMWINGQPITFFSGGTYNPSNAAATTRLNMATMDSSNNGGANMIILQSYRKVGMFSSVTVFEGPLAIGKTRSSVGG